MIFSTQWSRIVLLIGCTAVSTVGCDPSGTPGADGPHSTLGTVVGPCSTPPDAGAGGAGSTTPDELSLTDLPRNGLSPAALADPVTWEVLDRIATNPLNANTLISVRPSISSSENVRSLMEYVVSCALDEDVEVDTGVDVEGVREIWSGHLGLCGASSPLPSGKWAEAPPSQDCLELVSACVLARVNAHQKTVVISMRGEPNPLFPLRPEVPVQEAYRDNRIPPIPSFSPCPPGDSDGDPIRNCGWQGRFVGSCQPGDTVTLKAHSAADPEAEPVAMLRVCRGIYGCESNITRTPDRTGYYTPYYAGVIGSFADSPGGVTFMCPRNGVSLTDPSYFAVMMASPDPAVPLEAGVDVSMVTGGTYPSPEKEVFTYREGAFFGDLFHEHPDPQNPPPPGAMLVAEQYACYSEAWQLGIEQLTDRYCAHPGYSCFGNKPRPCLWQTRNPGVYAEGHVCGAQSCDAQNDYFGCSWGAGPWNHPITVFLNHPCDLARDVATCGTAFPEVLNPNNW